MSAPRRPRERGVVLVIVVVVTIMMLALIAAVLSLASNQVRLSNALTASNARAYYRARAGLVDARWRIRVNDSTEIGGGDFTNPAFDPAAYYIDLDTDTVRRSRTADDDVQVDISAVGANFPDERTIDSVGFQ